eukprot:CAMPEP_0177252272 /NCGR_PEP_ID=MMETSP0367-20130122/54450_1 /TAXON_ID=447022 ORGANISM="Scrippsiella hangoei-like, Strain SHHI-4" /NCGR_SAMPLE_ID=MMETSP0367 /ASSEMBLY_ACC=CAM_ASM_000362 /LENGTH=32 /DNA_ID= /DNA_START= /DNA_END= /DNA_ORIENTATION=
MPRANAATANAPKPQQDHANGRLRTPRSQPPA